MANYKLKNIQNVLKKPYIHTSIHPYIKSAICFVFFAFCFFAMPVCALEFDDSIDDDIRRNYNPSKIEEDLALPVLPKILNEKTEGQVKLTPVNNTVPKFQQKVVAQPQSAQHKPSLSQIPSGSFATIKKGTKIRAKMIGSVNDRTKKGTRVSFVSRYPVTTTYFTLPMGTVFNGEIVKVHRPQWTANGGLISIKVNSVNIDGSIRPLDGNITEVNYRKVFLNNIKGRRKYMLSTFRSMKPGFNYLIKMVKVSGDLMTQGSTIALMPFALATGVVAAAGNVAVAPVIAVFYKGGSAYIPDGSQIEIQLVQDVFIYN